MAIAVYRLYNGMTEFGGNSYFLIQALAQVELVDGDVCKCGVA